MTSLALDFIDSQRAQFTELSDRIWNLAELRYEEFASTDLHIRMLEEAGFRVTRGVADIPTAFIAEAGHGGPVIGILGEYDALSDQPGSRCIHLPAVGRDLERQRPRLRPPSARHRSASRRGSGEVASRTHGQPGTVRSTAARGRRIRQDVHGTCRRVRRSRRRTVVAPARVHGHLSGRFAREHPGILPLHGQASHAAASPHLGRSALDAVELMNVGVNYLREHMLPEARVHYAVTNTGGLSPNVVQANAEVLYLVRAARNDQAAELFERVKNVARGAAMMTDCRLEIVFDKACSNLLENAVLKWSCTGICSRSAPPASTRTTQRSPMRTSARRSLLRISKRRRVR